MQGRYLLATLLEAALVPLQINKVEFLTLGFVVDLLSWENAVLAVYDGSSEALLLLDPGDQVDLIKVSPPYVLKELFVQEVLSVWRVIEIWYLYHQPLA